MKASASMICCSCLTPHSEDPIDITENDMVNSDRSLTCTSEGQRFSVPGYKQMIEEMAEWMEEHKELYGQYEEFGQRNIS